MFRIVNLRTNIVWPEENGESEKIFKDGDEAALAAKNLNMLAELGWNIYVPSADKLNPSGTRDMLSDWFEGNVGIDRRDKWQVRKILSDEDWRNIQAKKISSGTFKPVPWAEHPAWKEFIVKKPQCDHFIHCSVKDEHAVAYTKNEEAGRMDIRTRISPSKYFEKFVTAAYAKYIPDWLALWTKYVTTTELKFATTRDEIRTVYEVGPDSCMSGPATKFFRRNGTPHPTEAYAAGDLAIAYTVKRNGKINSRAVVWPEKKIFGRRYGCDASLLETLLRANGYTTASSFEGARLLLIEAEPFTKKPGTYICPYLDSPTQFVSFHKNENVLKLHDRKTDIGRVAGNTQAGYLLFSLPFLSEFSGKEFSPAMDPPVAVRVNRTKSERWATSEASEHGYVCYINSTVYSKKTCPPTLVLVNDTIVRVSPFALEKLKIVKCEFYNCDVFYKDTERVIVGYEPDGSYIRERWSYQAIRGYSFANGDYRFAVWTRSNLPWACSMAASEEHKHSLSKQMGIKEATYPCRVTKDNVSKYLRRASFNAKTEGWVVTSPFDVEKIENALADGQRE